MNNNGVSCNYNALFRNKENCGPRIVENVVKASAVAAPLALRVDAGCDDLCQFATLFEGPRQNTPDATHDLTNAAAKSTSRLLRVLVVILYLPLQ